MTPPKARTDVRKSRAAAEADLHPVVLVMGKGGVGKTTIAAGLAVAFAQTQGEAVFVEFGDGESGKRALAEGGDRVEHIVIRPAQALQQAAVPLFGSAIVAKLVLGNFAIRPLLQAAPALRELAMLECLRQAVAKRPGARVIVDMPATGHGVAWLRVPAQGRDFLGAGPLCEMCDRIAQDIIAADRSSVVVVTLPEPLVVEETLELCAMVASEVGRGVDRIVVNRMPLPPCADALHDVGVLAHQPTAVGDAARVLKAILVARDAASREGSAALELLAGSHAVWHVPLSPSDPTVRQVAGWLREQGAR